MIFKFVILLIKLSAAFSVFSILPPWVWLLEVNANFGAYHLGLHILSLLWLFGAAQSIGAKCSKLLVLVLVLLSIWQAIPVVPFYLPDSKPSSNSAGASQQLSLLYANLETKRGNPELFKRIIAEHDPDILALLELSAHWDAALALDSSYPHTIKVLRDDNYGIGVYSKLPLSGEGERTIDLGSGLPPIIRTAIILDTGKTFKFTLVHAMPPRSDQALVLNYLLLRRIASSIRTENETELLVGDLNATPFSRYYKRFVEWTSLQNAMHGRGLLRTWNAHNPIFRMMIDHVFSTGEVRISGVNRLGRFGSDHFPLLIDFEI
ncbi:MAG: hypothetical protein DCC75_02485 [Proteobacteria bacterium]|nr:MAG: hypothetical protein DCC75_02485 [Pseudomonadota bacterium]